jgi:transporter family-2 protein
MKAAVLAAFIGGLGGAAQSRINGALAGHLHDGVAAALVNNTTALLMVSVAMAASPAARTALRRALPRLRPWECVGGVCGALYVASQGISVGALGLAAFTVAIVAGQSGGGLVVDRAGIAPGGRRPVNRARILGAVLTVGAVVLAVSGRLRAGAALGLAVLPLAAGAAQALQGAVNGRVRQAAGAVLPAVFVNAAVGTAALVVAWGVSLAVRGWPTGALPHQPWLYLGGAIGIGFIAIGVAVVRRIGVLLLGLAIVAGQLSGALALDLVAPGPAGRPGPTEILGTLLTLVAVAVAMRRDQL